MRPHEIYLDNNATTPIDEEVLDLMVATLRDNYGNPSSGHARGSRARKELETARAQIAALLSASPPEVVFTSGGTEGNNAVVAGALELRPGRRRLVMSAVEHPAIRVPMLRLAAAGYDVQVISVDAAGRLDLAAAKELITPETALVSVMAANNETGVLFPWEEVARLASEAGALMHVDAVQAVPRVPLSVQAAPVDFLTLSGHKLHASKGIGILWIRQGLRLPSLLFGGHQERGRRAGTENVPGAAAMGKACELFQDCDQGDVATRRDLLEAAIVAGVPHVRVNGAGAPRVPNTLSVGFACVEADALVHALSVEGICISTGSACASGSLELSHVLTAMAVPESYARGTVRFSLSVYTTDREIETVVEVLPGMVAELRELSAEWPPAGGGGASRDGAEHEAPAWRS